MKNLIRQGDLLFIPQDELPEYIRENENRKTDSVLEKGEATAIITDSQFWTPPTSSTDTRECTSRSGRTALVFFTRSTSP